MSIISPFRTDEQILAELESIQTVFRDVFHVELHQDAMTNVLAEILEEKIHDYIYARFCDWQPIDITKLIAATQVKQTKDTDKKTKLKKKPAEVQLS